MGQLALPDEKIEKREEAKSYRSLLGGKGKETNLESTIDFLQRRATQKKKRQPFPAKL